MAATRVFVSPGVYTSEKELSFVAQSVGVTTLGVVGETLKGPAFEPIFVTSYDDFTTYFGGTSPEKFVNTQIPKYETAYIAKSYLQQSNQLFVTRILGLSGYDAGPSWSFKTIGQVDFDTIEYDPNYQSGLYYDIVIGYAFTATTGSSYTTVQIDFNTDVVYSTGAPPFRIDIPFTYQGNTTTLLDEIKKAAQVESDQYGDSGSTSNFNYVVGSIPNSGTYAYSTISSSTIYNLMGVSDLNGSTADLTSETNRKWYQTIFNYGNPYVGFGFFFFMDDGDFTSPSPGVVTGVVQFAMFSMTGTPNSNFDNLVVATLRSRGITDYSVSNGGPVYEVTGTTDVLINCDTTPTSNPTGFTTYNELNYNPYAVFTLSGVTRNGTNFSYETSLSNSDSHFITKVCGVSNFDKSRTTNPVFVEEIFSNLLNYGYSYGYIKGISCDLVTTEGARQYFLNNPNNTTGDTLGWYMDKYQTPATPWVVSQLQGNKVTRLFRFISISDGNAANTEIKVSILNISFTNGTFDVAVRQYSDTDSNAVVIEKFTNCTMDPDTPGYIAKKIGTQSGEYGLNSKYIMVEINPDADPDTLPCGFEGYLVREYNTGTTSPFPIYKTKYNYAGELLYTSPTLGQVLSTGDKVRRTYLGVTNQLDAKIGIDADMWQYKGRKYAGICNETNPEWNYQTKGFHMDKNATVCVIGPEYTSSGQTAFYVGDGDFTSEPTSQTNPYYYLYSRKFTLTFQGGFDGWNIYDERRTNSDEFQIGKFQYLNSACISARFPNSTGYIFKQITIDGNSVDWATTDYYAYLLGIQTFNNPASVNINVFATPGIDYLNNQALVSNAIDMVENERADSIYVVTTPDWDLLTSNNTDYSTYFVQPQDAVDVLETSAIDSNYTATYYPWVLTRDSDNNTQIYLPPTAEVTRNLALTDNIAFPWFATAGYTRGIVNAVKARKKLTQEDRDTLYTGRINPIATFSDVGTVIWGNKTLQLAESALNRINVRRLLLQARKLISAVAIRLLFEQNDAKVRQDFLDAVNPILDSIRRDRGLYDFRVTVSSSVEDLDKNQLVGKIYIKPTKALEFIDIEFLITPTGASFENI